jgi:hypothetical protein
MRRRNSIWTVVLAAGVLGAAAAAAWDVSDAGRGGSGPATPATSRDSAAETNALQATPRAPRLRAAAREREAAAPEATRSPPSADEDTIAWRVRSSRVLRVVDPEGVPQPGVGFAWTDAEGQEHESETDASGEQSLFVGEGPAPTVRLSGDADPQEVVLAEPVTTVVDGSRPVFEIAAVDASTALPVAVPYVAVEAGSRGSAWTWSTTADDRAVHRLPLRGGREFDAKFALRPPEGFAALRRMRLSGEVAVQARRARVVLPVFPAASWTLQLRDPAGAPVEGASASSVELATAWNAESSDSWESAFALGRERSGADGKLVLVGVPRIAANAATVEVTRDIDWETLAPGFRGVLSIPRLDVPAPAGAVELRLEYWNESSSVVGYGSGHG